MVGDYMVLQRDKPIKLWGYADNNENIKVTFAGITQTTTASSGKWSITFPAMRAGGPYSIIIAGNNTIELKDILIGDVWICSGQSNMEFNLQDAENADEEVKNAAYSSIRLFTVEKSLALSPDNDTKGRWTVCAPGTAKYFSAVGYFFGRDLNKTLKIPIGLINTSWGGTVIESWISAEGLKGEPTFGNEASQLPFFDTLTYNTNHRMQHDLWIQNFQNQDKGFEGKYIWAQPLTKMDDWNKISLPTIWEFTDLQNLKNLDGIVWFKKEIELSENDIKDNATLTMGVIQNSDVTFINGVQIGFTPDIWGRNRSYVIPAFVLKKGQNIITARVSNYGGDGGFASKSEDLIFKTHDRTLSLAGEWHYKVGYKLSVYNRPEKEFGPNSAASVLFNSMISPLTKFSIKGVIWYQGESNWFRGYQYRDLFPRLISDWRNRFNQEDFPFLYVQLANHHEKQEQPGQSYWAELREAQDMTLKVKNIAMATAIDIGDAGNIHPKNKQEVGRRLALGAKSLVYKLPVIPSGPRFSSFEIKGNYILIHFSGIGKGLKPKDNLPPGSFQIASSDQNFKWATAEIMNKNTIKVYNSTVSTPVAVRYAWEDNPADANLVNSEMLPAFPFRTDQWKGISAGNTK